MIALNTVHKRNRTAAGSTYVKAVEAVRRSYEGDEAA